MSIVRRRLWQFYLKLERALLPGLINPEDAYRDTLRKNINENTRWLDLGCGHKFYSSTLPDSEAAQKHLVEEAELVVGIDGNLDALRMNKWVQCRTVGDIHKLPFDDRSFNLVTANMVVEHVSDPSALLSEVRRVLETGGTILFHTPNAHNYKILAARAIPERLKKPIVKYLQNRKGSDVFPTHYRLNKLKAMKDHARIAGLQVKEVSFYQGPADSVMLGPLVVFELLWMKVLSSRWLRKLQSNIIILLEKEG